MKQKEQKHGAELKTNSTTWGNYNNATFDITRGLYTTAPTVSGSWNGASEINKYTKPASTSTLLTTGATDRNSALGIYDLAGNVYEWTLERYTSDNRYPCTIHGGRYSHTGSYSSARRDYYTTTGFQPLLRFSCRFMVGRKSVKTKR